MAKTKKKVKPEAQDIKLEDLEQVVDEVNEQLDLDPGIEKGSDAHMRKELKEAMTDEDLFEGDEEFTKETYKVFEVLGIEHDAVKIKSNGGGADINKDENGDIEEVVITDVPPKKKQERTAKKENKKGENEKMKTKTKTTVKKSTKKKAAGRVCGAYSTMIDILCSHPGISRDDLRKQLTKKGVKEYKDTAFNTAYQSCNSVFNRLASNGKLKLNGKG